MWNGFENCKSPKRKVAWFQGLSCQLTLTLDWSIQISRAPAVCKDAVMPQNCCVPEYKEKVYVENGVKISFHTFPEERKLFMKLIVAVRRDMGKHFQVTTHTRVCSRHFKPSDYLPSLAGRKMSLKPTAVSSSTFCISLEEEIPSKMEGANKKKSNQKEKGHRKGNYESWFTNVRLHVRSIFGAAGNSVSHISHRKFGKYYSIPTSWWLTKYHLWHSNWKWTAT